MLQPRCLHRQLQKPPQSPSLANRPPKFAVTTWRGLDRGCITKGPRLKHGVENSLTETEGLTQRAVTKDVPHREAVCIPFAANPGLTHLESVKRIPFTLSDATDPPFMHSRTTENWRATLGKAFSFDDGTLPRFLQWQENTPSPTAECNHVAAAHSSTEVLRPRCPTSHVPGRISCPLPPSFSTHQQPCPCATISTTCVQGTSMCRTSGPIGSSKGACAALSISPHPTPQPTRLPTHCLPPRGSTTIYFSYIYSMLSLGRAKCGHHSG